MEFHKTQTYSQLYKKYVAEAAFLKNNCFKMLTIKLLLTFYFPMFPFDPPDQKGALGSKGLRIVAGINLF